MINNKKFIVFILVSSSILSSCKSNIEEDIKENFYERKVSPKNITLRGRLKPMPLPPKLYKEKDELRSLSSNSPNLLETPYNSLGAVHRIGNGILGCPTNITNNGVINVKSILNDKETSKYLFNYKLIKDDSHLEYYESINDITRVISKSKKINAGFHLNLGLFSIGNITTYTELSHKYKKENTKSIYGQLDLYYHFNTIGLETTKSALSKITYRNLDESFISAMYYTPISDYVKNKGYLIVSNIITGGRAMALLDISISDKLDISGNAKALSSLFSASYGWGKNDNKSSDKDKNKDDDKKSNTKDGVVLGIGIAKGNAEVNSLLKSISNINCYLTTFGGQPLHNTPNVPVDLKNKIIDLSEWRKSLADEKTHSFIEIGDGGLIGIDNFVLEKNLKKIISNVITNDSIRNYEMQEPCVELRNFSYNLLGGTKEPKNRTAISFIIHTRHGDKIAIIDEDFKDKINGSYRYQYDDGDDEADDFNNEVDDYLLEDEIDRLYSESIYLNQSELNESYDEFNREALDLYVKLRDKFSCKITKAAYPTDILTLSDIKNPTIHYDYIHMYAPPTYIYSLINFSFDENNLYKYQNPRTHIWYIYDKKNKTALSYYDGEEEDDDDYILSTYGLEDWASKIKIRRIPMRLLMDYDIIAL